MVALIDLPILSPETYRSLVFVFSLFPLVCVFPCKIAWNYIILIITFSCIGHAFPMDQVWSVMVPNRQNIREEHAQHTRKDSMDYNGIARSPGATIFHERVTS